MAKYSVILPKPPFKTKGYLFVLCENASAFYEISGPSMEFEVPDQFEWIYAKPTGSTFEVLAEYKKGETIKRVSLVPQKLAS